MSRPTYAFPLMVLCCAFLSLAGANAAAQTAAPAFGECKLNTGAATPAAASAPAAATTGTPAAATGTPAAAPAAAESELTSGVRIQVKGADGKPVQRRRFYLLQRGVKDAPGVRWATVPKRSEYLKGASPELLAVLDQNDCDTLYCPALINQYEKLTETVPEFRRALQTGTRKYRSRKLALDWLMVNFPLRNVRTGFFDRKQEWLEQAAKQAGAVASVMTNEDGEAFFTRVKLGSYHVSNLIPTEDGVVWDCSVSVPPPSKKELHSVSVVMSAAKPAAGGEASK